MRIENIPDGIWTNSVALTGPKHLAIIDDGMVEDAITSCVMKNKVPNARDPIKNCLL